MKPMNQRNMDMKKGEPESSAFFPDMPHRRELPRAGEIKDFKYPDTDEMIHSDQNQFVKATNANMPKPEFRH
jgi:hypothetical protein